MILPLLLPPLILYPQLHSNCWPLPLPLCYMHTQVYTNAIYWVYLVLLMFKTDQSVWDNISHGSSLEKIDILSLQAITGL